MSTAELTLRADHAWFTMQASASDGDSYGVRFRAKTMEDVHLIDQHGTDLSLAEWNLTAFARDAPERSSVGSIGALSRHERDDGRPSWLGFFDVDETVIAALIQACRSTARPILTLEVDGLFVQRGIYLWDWQRKPDLLVVCATVNVDLSFQEMNE